MLRFLSICLIALSLTYIGCEVPSAHRYEHDFTDQDLPDYTLISSFTGAEDLEVLSAGTIVQNPYGFSRRNGRIQFTVTTTDDARFSGTRVQRDSIYTTEERETLMKGTFEWTNEGGSWTGSFSGTFSLITGTELDLKGYGQGGYENLYFECHSSCPGDPTQTTGSGTFEGNLYERID